MSEQLLMLKNISKVLCNNNINNCLMWGTLLGIYRDNKLIQWDNEDIDFAIFEPFWKDEDKLYKIMKDLFSLGYLINEVSKNYVCIKQKSLKALHVDLYLFKEEEKSLTWIGRDKIFTFIKTTIFPIGQMKFEDIVLNIPNNVEETIKQIYGNDWTKPKKPEKVNYYNTTPTESKMVDLTFTYIVNFNKKDL